MIVAGNWKMNLNINEAIELSNGLLKHSEVFVEEKIIIFPSFLIMPEIYNLYKNSKISIGAQIVQRMIMVHSLDRFPLK